ncbi:DUF3592 domain-containing protein [Actinomadura rudentiformis]|nr:DUF3592 domain-containing protein [Actinomadura rudentiformis]
MSDRPPVQIGTPAQVIAGISALFAALGCLAAFPVVRGEMARAQNSRITMATILSTYDGRLIDGAHVAFTTAAGRRVEAQVASSRFRDMRVGTTVKIRYAPSTPAHTAVDSEESSAERLAMPGAFWAMAIAFGIGS